IAVDVGTPLAKLDRNASLLAVVSQISGMMTTGNTGRQLSGLRESDVLIVPELGDTVATADFAKAREALAIGADAAEDARARLAALAAPADVHASSLVARTQVASERPLIEFVRIDNQ